MWPGRGLKRDLLGENSTVCSPSWAQYTCRTLPGSLPVWWLERTFQAPLGGWVPRHAALGQSVLWEQIRSGLRGAFYQLLCSQRPDDLQGVT